MSFLNARSKDYVYYM